MSHTRQIVVATLVAAFVVLLGLGPLVTLATDWLWFQAVGYETVFTTALWTRVGLGVAAAAVAFVFLFLNLRAAQRGIVPELSTVRGPGTAQVDLNMLLRRLSTPLAIGFAVLFGLSASTGWLTFLQFLRRTPFGETDPVFGYDIGRYIFTLPALSLGLGLVQGLVILALIVVVPLYAIRRDLVFRNRRVMIEASAERHLAFLLMAVFLLLAVETYFLDLPSLVYSRTGPLFGASYTDLTVTAPLLKVTAVTALLGAVVIGVGLQQHRLARMTAVAIAAYVVVGWAIGRGAPAIFQRLVVAPNELVKERPQLAHHIAATRRAWGLDHVATRDLTGEAHLTLADIQANQGTISNVRLWDREPLLQTFRQLQEIRTYYDFVSVDDDRYWINGGYRQVLLSPRELNSASLPQRTFINERLTFTHGMGLTLSPVNQVTSEGLPVLFVKDLPPVSDVSVDVSRPGIYYGELPLEWVVVRTRQAEFDYPAGDENAVTEYHGTGGVTVNSFLRRLLFSLRFQSTKMLLSQDITDDSRILLHRNIVARVSRALPFLRLDGDPYMVVTEDGHLVWILDGYTHSNRYPYAQPLRDGTNYLRNSVKVVVDAYDGTIQAYASDPTDPILQTYDQIFGGILLPLETMPADLRAHLRYPEDLFQAQTVLHTTYHMDQPDVFYHREDQWQIPTVSKRGEDNRDPFLRHIIMKLPGEAQEEYILMTPFTPRGKDNLAAWMVARSDGDHYGQLVVYRFPRQSLVFGPAQIVNRINQDTEISRQISLWDQRGSQVITGNLLVIPIEESLLFVQAIYLRAEGGRIPELKRVVVAYQNQVVMEETLEAGLARLFGEGGAQAEAEATPSARAAAAEAAAPARDVIEEARRHYDRAVAAQRAGDWARYGEELRQLGEALNRLRREADGAP